MLRADQLGPVERAVGEAARLGAPAVQRGLVERQRTNSTRLRLSSRRSVPTKSSSAISSPDWRAARRTRTAASSVREVPGAGEVHGDAGLPGRLDRQLVPDRTARLDDRPDAGRRSAPAGRPGTGRRRRRRRRNRPPGHRPGPPPAWPSPPGSPDPSRPRPRRRRGPAGSRWTSPPGPRARRRPARPARASCSGGAAGQLPVGRVVAGRVDRVGVLQQHPAGDRPELVPDRPRTGNHQQPQVLHLGQRRPARPVRRPAPGSPR